MIDKNKLRKVICATESKKLEEMTKKELVELVEVITDGFIETFNDNVVLSSMLKDLQKQIDEIKFTILKCNSIFKFRESEE
jgi:hypothetical protein